MSNTSKVMSNREYDKFLKDRKLEAFKRCDPVVQGTSRYSPEFVECSRNRVLSVAWACRQQNKNMFDCLRHQYVRYFSRSMSDDAMAQAEKEYLAQHRTSPPHPRE